MATGTLISVEKYLSTVYEPECEYVEGEVVDRNVGELDHSAVQTIVTAILYNQRREAGIHVFTEVRVQVAARRFRVPDITVLTKPGNGRIVREAPFLCIEILSPEDRAGRMQEKIDDYFSFGVRYVWVIDPRNRKGWVYTSEGRIEKTGVLTTQNPGLRLPLEDLFSALSEEITESE